MSYHRVLVTGANGFIGRVLCRDLLAAGKTVRGTIRRQEAAQLLPQGVEPRLVGNLAPPGAWRQAVADIDVVVHLAGRAHAAVRGAQAERDHAVATVVLTQQVMAACREVGVPRCVFMSTVAVIGSGSRSAPGEPAAIYSETTSCTPVDAYGRAKLEAERVVRRVGDDAGIETVVLRPPMVYGPGAPGNFARLLRLVRRLPVVPVPSVAATRSFIYVGNLSSALLRCIDEPGAAGEVFLVADAEAVSIEDLVRKLARLLGRRTRTVALPVAVLRFAGRVAGRSDDIGRLVNSLVVSTQKIRETLGWTPPFSLDEGLLRTLSSSNDAEAGTSAAVERA